MLTQSYYTPNRMEYSGGSYVTPTIYPMTPPYTNGYDHLHTDFLSMPIKPSTSSPTYDHKSISRYFADRSGGGGGVNSSVDFHHTPPPHILFPPTSSNSCANSLRRQLPTPPSLSTSPLSVGRYASNESLPPSNQYDEFIEFSGNSGCVSSGTYVEKTQRHQNRKTVIMKVDEQKVINDNSSSLKRNCNGSRISDTEEEFICKWEFCYK